MAKQQFNIRLDDATLEAIAWLQQQFGDISQADAVTLAVKRLVAAEKARQRAEERRPPK